MPKFTPTQSAILAILSDGLPHPRKIVLEALDDPLADRKQLNLVLFHIRKKLRPIGQDIVPRLKGFQINYQHVRLLNTSE